MVAFVRRFKPYQISSTYLINYYRAIFFKENRSYKYEIEVAR